MIRSSLELYKKIVTYLQSDEVLKNLLSNVYDQAPLSATIPYMYAHLHSLGDLGTLDKKAHWIEAAFYTFSHSLEEIVEIAERTRNLSTDFFHAQKKCALAHMKCKITNQKHGDFQSIVNFEVLISDYGKVSE